MRSELIDEICVAQDRFIISHMHHLDGEVSNVDCLPHHPFTLIVELLPLLSRSLAPSMEAIDGEFSQPVSSHDKSWSDRQPLIPRRCGEVR